jgi:hypothetical protein
MQDYTATQSTIDYSSWELSQIDHAVEDFLRTYIKLVLKKTTANALWDYLDATLKPVRNYLLWDLTERVLKYAKPPNDPVYRKKNARQL